jgi:hypothetical protein
MADLQNLSITVAAVSVVLGVAYNMYNLRLQTKARQAQIYLGIWQKMNSEEASKAWKLWANVKIGNYEEWKKLFEDQVMGSAFYIWLSIFQGVAIFVREGLIDIRLLARDMGNTYVFWWRKYETFFKQHRTVEGFPRYMIEAEWLYNKLIEFGQRNPDFNIG